jgi:hypothetical protein
MYKYVSPSLPPSIQITDLSQTGVDWWVILAFSSIVLIPAGYYFCIVFWLPRTAVEKTQYLIGLSIYLIVGPFINITVLAYSLWNMDEFGWGKTRKVVEELPDEVEKNGKVPDESANNEHVVAELPGDEENRASLGRGMDEENRASLGREICAGCGCHDRS